MNAIKATEQIIIRNSAVDSHPRIIYAGPIDGTCAARLFALREIEPNVAVFDTRPFFQNRAFFPRIDEKLFQSGASFARANDAFLRLCDTVKPEIAWIDKGYWLWTETLRTLRQNGVFLAQHNTDKLSPDTWAMRGLHRLLRKTLPLYHLYFTSNIPDHAALTSAKIFSPDDRGRASRLVCELTHLGYDRQRFNADPLPPAIAEKWSSDLLFAGHYEPRTERGILALLDAGLSVRVYGRDWRRAKHGRRLERATRFEPLNDADYVHALKGAKIGLCFFSEVNHNQTAGRSFEIPACGTFLLAMRSPQHLACYNEGLEAEFFGDEKELVEKARRYLADDAGRREIAQRGHARCVGSDYSWARYMRDDWAKTLRMFAAFKKT